MGEIALTDVQRGLIQIVDRPCDRSRKNDAGASAAISMIKNTTPLRPRWSSRIGPIAPTDENKLLFSVEGRRENVASTGTATGQSRWILCSGLHSTG